MKLQLFDSHSDAKTKVLLLDLAIVNPLVSSVLENYTRHFGQHLADIVERKKNSIGARSSLSSPSFLSLYRRVVRLSQTNIQAAIKELAIRLLNARSEKHSDESRYLAEGTEVARLWWRVSLLRNRPFHSIRGIVSAGMEGYL